MSEQPIILQGDKIILRPWRKSDADPLWDSIHNEEFNKLTGTHDSFTREQIDTYVDNQIAAAGSQDRGTFIIALPDTDEAIGEVVINEVDHDNHSGNIRIGMFSDEHVGKGYGTEAMRLMVGYGFDYLNLHRIELGVYAFNPRAIRAYEKAGFVKEGVRRDALCWNGEYYDSIDMSILRHEWQKASTN